MNDWNTEITSRGDDFENELPLTILSKNTMKRMKFKKADLVKSTIAVLVQDFNLTHPISHYGLFICSDGVFMDDNRSLGSYFLQKMENIQIKKREKSPKVVRVLLPSGETQEIEYFEASTAQGILRGIREKPSTFASKIPTLSYTTSSGEVITIRGSDILSLSEGLNPNVTLRYGERESIKKQSPTQNILNRTNAEFSDLPIITNVDTSLSVPLKQTKNGIYQLKRTEKANYKGKPDVESIDIQISNGSNGNISNITSPVPSLIITNLNETFTSNLKKSDNGDMDIDTNIKDDNVSRNNNNSNNDIQYKNMTQGIEGQKSKTPEVKQSWKEAMKLDISNMIPQVEEVSEKGSPIPTSHSDCEISSKLAASALSNSLNLSSKRSVVSLTSPRKKLKEDIECLFAGQARLKTQVEENRPTESFYCDEIEQKREKKSTISINILIEEVRQTFIVDIESDGKISVLLQLILQKLVESEIALKYPSDQYTIYHPIKNKMSKNSLVKSYNLKNEDLLILKEKKKMKKTVNGEKSEKTEKSEKKSLRSRFKIQASVAKSKNDSQCAVKSIEPHVIRKLIRVLTVSCAVKEVGIFRISGNTEKILQIVNNINNPNFQLTQLGSHEIAGALKYIFRTSEEPLIPPSLYNQFISCHNGTVIDKDKLKCNIKLLSDEKRNILGALMMYLHELSNHSDVNLMTKQNIAIVFGPTLLRSVSPDTAFDFSRTGSLSDIVECMIEFVTDFFTEDERNPGPFTPRAMSEEAEKERLSRYMKLICDIQSPVDINDLSVYDNFSSLISEDENFVNYMESYSKKELLQLMSKVVGNFLKSSHGASQIAPI